MDNTINQFDLILDHLNQTINKEVTNVNDIIN